MIIVQKSKPKACHLEHLRLQMIQNQLKPLSIQNEDILSAFESVQREHFLPKEHEHLAYHDQLIHFSKNRTMLPPITIAKILNAIDLKSIQKALVIGCGLGYTVSILNKLNISTLGIDHSVHINAALKKHPKFKSFLKSAPLIQGDDENAPFDLIFIEGGVESVPITLIKQLKDSGYLAALIFKGKHLPLTATIFKKQENVLSPIYSFESNGSLLNEFSNTQTFEF
ncbi:MAG: hypothetical protein KBD31_04640 [Proteobacteria bacterium]|nr:hypothetical protein [Pseudomonadota bacterium]